MTTGIRAEALDRFLVRCSTLAAQVGPSDAGQRAVEALAQELSQLVGRLLGVPPDDPRPDVYFSLCLWAPRADWATWCCNTSAEDHAQHLRDFAAAVEKGRGLH
jgi:hypothetical protein